MKVARPYQVESVEAVQSNLKNGCNRQLVVMATGLGKTFTAIKIIEQMNVRTLWITHTEDLIEQSAFSILENMLDKDHVQHIAEQDGIIQYMRNNSLDMLSDEKDRSILNRIGLIKRDLFEINKPIVVASIQTLHRRLERINPNHFGLIIVDEAHLSAAETWTKAIEHFKFELLLGLTATPHRADGVSLTNLFDKIVFERDIAWGISNKYLCELDAFRVKTGVDISKVGTTAGDFNQKQLGNEIDTYERNQLIVSKYKEYASGRPFIVFCLDIAHAQNMASAFNEGGINTTFVVSDETLCPNRRERINDFKSGIYEGMTNVGILTAGFDYPDIQCVIMARPTKSLTLYLQCIGRGTRVKTNEGNCIILDIVDVSGKHSLINTWTLDANKSFEDKIFMSEKRKNEAIEKREANKIKVDKEIDRDGRVDLMKLPEIVIYDNYNNRQHATPAQLKLMEKMGYNILDQAWTMGQCREVISSLSCSNEKLEKLKQWGYETNGATIGQFSIVENLIATQSKYKNLIQAGNVKLPFKNLR